MLAGLQHDFFFNFNIYKMISANLDPSELRLLYTNKQLEDTDKFSDHGIKDKSMIMAVLRLPGGGMNPVISC